MEKENSCSYRQTSRVEVDDDLTPEQMAELDATLRDIDSGKAKTSSWEDVKAKILSKHKKKTT